MFFWREGGEGRARGAKAVDFKQGTWRKEIHHHGQETTFQVRVFSFLIFSFYKRAHLLVMFVYAK
jgi:hypothetical protein